jgi:KDO2-lipid IV(A) lauroyltransferase
MIGIVESPSDKRPRRRRRIRRALRPLRHWLVVQLFLFGHWLCTRISHRRAVSIGRWLGRVGYLLAHGERKKTLRHLEMAFGHELSAEDRERIAREVFQSIGMNTIEAMNSMAWTDGDYRARVDFEGLEHAEAALTPGKGSIYMTAHFGNWELMPQSYLAKTGIAVGVIMQDTRIPKLTELIRSMRANKGNIIFSANDSAIRYLRALRKGGVIAMLADQDTKKQSGTHVKFFGLPALTPTGGPFLAKKSGASILPLFIRRRRDDPTRHVFRCHPPIFSDPALSDEEDVHRMLQAYTSILEQEVRENPGQWVWMHERWRHQPKGQS